MGLREPNDSDLCGLEVAGVSLLIQFRVDVIFIRLTKKTLKNSMFNFYRDAL